MYVVSAVWVASMTLFIVTVLSHVTWEGTVSSLKQRTEGIYYPASKHREACGHTRTFAYNLPVVDQGVA